MSDSLKYNGTLLTHYRQRYPDARQDPDPGLFAPFQNAMSCSKPGTRLSISFSKEYIYNV